MGTLVPMAAAKPFFDALFLDVVGPDARIVVFALPDRRSESFDSTEAAAEYAVSRAGDSDVYFGCGLYRPGIKAGRGEAADVVGITAVWADIDCGTGHKKNVPPDEDSARRVLDSIGIKPSILVDSGHGLHAYWLLSEFVSAEDGAADLARRWCGHVQAIARAQGGWTLDSVGDLARILRVPGTFNRKADPRPVRLLTQLGETVPRYHSDELLDLCAEIPEAASTEPPVIAESLALDPNAAPPAEKLAAFIENDTKFRRTWEHDRPDLKDQSPPAYDQSLASQAASAGWTEQETANLLIAFRRKTGADVTKTLRPDYMPRTIGTGGAGNNGSPKANSEPKDPPLVWEPFPTHVLPEAVRSFITAASKAIGCDDSMVALPLLAGLASAIGTTRRIRLKRKWCEPSILWTAIIAGSGQLKSPAFDIALEPICKRQSRLLREHWKALQIHEAESLNYDVALAKWKSDKKTDPDTTPPEKPVEPVAVRTHTADPTIEALGQLLRENPRGLLLARDELSGWIASFDAYKHASGADIANWLQLHRGREMLTDRKTGNRITYVPMAACSVCGTIQPQTFRNFIANEDNLANGFCARVLLAEPPPRRKRWTEADVPVGVEDRLHEVFERLYELDHYERADGERDPIDVVLSDAAKRAWIEFFTVLADVQFNLDDENLAAAFSKLEGYAARFALIVHLVRWASGDAANPNVIDAGDIEAGAALSRWFCHEARRIYGTFAESAEQRERRQNLERVGKAGGFVTVRGWHRLKHHKSASDAEAELQCLVDAGFGLWEHDAPSDRGGRPGKRFVLCDSVTRDKTPTHDRATGGIVTCHTVTRGSTKLEADPLDRASGGDDEPPPDALANKIDSGAFDADEAGGSEGPNGPPTGAAFDSGDRTANFGGCER